LTTNLSQAKTLIGLGAISAPASTVLANLVLDPKISFTPYYIVVLGIGFVFFVLSLGVFFEQKAPFTLKESAWNIFSIGIAGFVFVSWARYQSLIWSAIAAAIMFVSILGAILFKRKDIGSNYQKGKVLVYVGLFAIMVLPVATVAQNFGQSPEIFLTANPPEIIFNDSNQLEQSTNITVSTVYGSAWQVTITADCSEQKVYTYLDGKMNPVEYGMLDRGSDANLTLLTKVSQEISDGVYTIALHYKFADWLSQTHEGTKLIWVNVNLHPQPTPTPVGPASGGFNLPANLLITVVAIIAEVAAYAFIALSKLQKIGLHSSHSL
jgi:hypothetical protein